MQTQLGSSVAGEWCSLLCEVCVGLSQSAYMHVRMCVQGHSVDVKCLALSAGRPDHFVLFRKHVTRRIAGNGRAVLEGVGLDAPTIAA